MVIPIDKIEMIPCSFIFFIFIVVERWFEYRHVQLGWFHSIEQGRRESVMSSRGGGDGESSILFTIWRVGFEIYRLVGGGCDWTFI